MSAERQTDGNAASVSEPVIRFGDQIQIHCPECLHLGTHLGTCSWSQMRSGRLWAFYAEAVDIEWHRTPTRHGGKIGTQKRWGG